MIFNIFRSKPTLRELIPNGFVDIHSHILPGIDDGAKTVAESLEIISKMKKLGFSKVIGTPHIYEGVHNNTTDSIKSSFNKLKESLNDDVKISYASEYMLDSSILKLLESKKLLTLDDKYILVEMSYIAPPKNLFDIIFELKVNNYRPIVAHPERYRFLHNEINVYKKLKSMGCEFQMNLLSVTGYYGDDIRKFCDILLKNNMVKFSGSDIHSIRHVQMIESSQVIVGSKKKMLRANIKQLEKFEKILENNQIFN